jgi:uncharacterized membrane protein YoaK (UPF0700 family)
MIGGIFLTNRKHSCVFDLDDYLFYFVAALAGAFIISFFLDARWGNPQLSSLVSCYRIKNGTSSICSANLICSTTHLTGTSADIGIFIGQLLKGNRQNLWKLLILMALATVFWLGSLISFYLTPFFTHFSLLFNAGMFMMIGVTLVCFVVVELEVSVEAAIMGKCGD